MVNPSALIQMGLVLRANMLRFSFILQNSVDASEGKCNLLIVSLTHPSTPSVNVIVSQFEDLDIIEQIVFRSLKIIPDTAAYSCYVLFYACCIWLLNMR